MSLRTEKLRDELADLDERLRLAYNLHQQAKSTFGRFEGPAGSPLWHKLRAEVDSTLTHSKVLEACWHRTKAALLDQQAKEV